MLDAALNYARRGWRVFPLQPKDKRPAISAWTDQATVGAKQIKAWWKVQPNANVAIATGPESSIVVIDIDTKSDGDRSLEDLAQTFGPLPPTYTVATGGGGWHYYFAYPRGEIHNSQSLLAKGIDIRGWHGYVVAPPSVHPNGVPYHVVADLPLAPLPDWILERLSENTVRAKAETIPDTIPDGERHRHIVSVAGTMRNRGCNAAEILAAITVLNKRCQTPKTQEELEAIAGSMERYRPGRVPEAKMRGELQGPPLQSFLEEDIPRWLVRNDIAADATGAWVSIETRKILGLSIPKLATTYANHFRRSRQPIGSQFIGEILAEVHDRLIAERRAALVASLTGTTKPEGGAHLSAWLTIVAGECRPLDLAVMRHWLWLVKRSLLELPAEHHLMPIFVGAQGSGKSTAVGQFLAPLKELALIPVAGDLLTDSRWAPALGRYAVGLWDEMEGADKANIEALKRTISSSMAVYRPMQTNEIVRLPVRAHWIGTSNKSVSTMIRDTTGNRRFYEIHTRALMDWDALRSIDYDAIWSSVDPRTAAPIAGFLRDLSNAQEDQRFRDNIGQFLDACYWGQYRDDDGRQREATDPTKGLMAMELFARYRAWCREYKEEPFSNQYVGGRAQEEGWTRRRDPDPPRAWRYFPTKAV